MSATHTDASCFTTLCPWRVEKNVLVGCPSLDVLCCFVGCPRFGSLITKKYALSGFLHVHLGRFMASNIICLTSDCIMLYWDALGDVYLPLVGHDMPNLSLARQARPDSVSLSAWRVAWDLLRQQGPQGLYRGSRNGVLSYSP